VAELFFEVPINYSQPGDGVLQLFARSICRAVKPVDPGKDEKHPQLPWLVYLQGGPGMGCRPPQEYGWVGTALDKGYQV
jgi:proline iminopeptidase